MPKISIIVPVYNVEKYLKKCIDSILNQTFKDFELILVDDGSTDRSGILCDEFAAIDNRIKIIHKNNAGVSAARNDGINISTSEYIIFVDSDDYIDEKLLEDMFKYKDSDLVISGLRFVNTAHKKIKECFEESFVNENIKDFMRKYYKKTDEHMLLSGPYNKLYKKSIIQSAGINFCVDISICEDGLFVTEYLSNCRTITNIDKCYYNYVQYKLGNLMQKYNSNAVEASIMYYNSLLILMLKTNNTNNKELLDYIGIKELSLMRSFYSQIYYRSSLTNVNKYFACKEVLKSQIIKELLNSHKNISIGIRMLHFAANKNCLLPIHILYSINYTSVIRNIKKFIRSKK